MTVVLALAAVNAQMGPNSTCCPPSFVALGYNALRDFQFNFYYDSLTGDNLEVDTRGTLMTLGESATGRIYTRKMPDNVCTYVEFPELKGIKGCILPSMTFMGAELLDSRLYYEWRVAANNMSGTLVVDDQCLTKILHNRAHNTPLISNVFFNHVPNG
ncbi:hypothetical protein ACRFG5_27800, partial [Klebsiella pneumoniae]